MRIYFLALFFLSSLCFFSKAATEEEGSLEKLVREIENANSEYDQIVILEKVLYGKIGFFFDREKNCSFLEKIKHVFDKKNPKHFFILSYIYHLLSLYSPLETRFEYCQKAVFLVKSTNFSCYEDYYILAYKIHYSLDTHQHVNQEEFKEIVSTAYANLEKKGCKESFYLIAEKEAYVEKVKANLSMQLSNLLKAIDYYEKYSQHTAKKDSPFYILILYETGMIYYNLKNYTKSLEYWLKTIAFLEEKNVKSRVTVNTYNSIGLSYMKSGAYKQAPYYYEKAIALAKEIQDSIWIGIPQGNLATLFLQEKKFAQAKFHLQEYLNAALTYQEHGIVVVAYIKFAYMYQLQQKWQESLDYLKKAEDYLTQNKEKIRTSSFFNYLEYCVNLFDKYVQTFTALQNYEKAFYYLQKKEVYNDSLNQYLSRRQIEELEAKYKLKEQEKENLLLKTQLKAQEDELKLGRLFTITTVVLIVSSFVSGFFIMRYINIKRKYISQLENLNKVKDKLFSVISHDLRSFIANLRNFVMLVSEHELKKEEYDMIVEELSKSTEETSIMMDNLLLWAKSQLQGFRLHYRVFSIQDLLQKSFTELRWMAEKKKITLQADISPQVELVFADSMMLEIILRNFITNAIKFSQYNSMVLVKVRTEGEKYVFEVKDHGVGMTEEQIKQITNGSIQSKRGTYDEKGTGLGLLICKEAIAEMQGSFWVESQINKGTSVFFTLPVQKHEILKKREVDFQQLTSLQGS